MKQARVVVTFKCPRSCPGCCNTYSSIMASAKTIHNFDGLKDYDVIMLTGGEPMLFPDRTIKMADIIHKKAPNAKIFLYTALHKSDGDLSRVLQHVDGVQFSLHAEANDKDIEEFHKFQEVAKKHVGSKSFRLYIDSAMPKELQQKVRVNRSVWKRFEVKPWSSEEELLAKQPKGLPSGEDLFVLQRSPNG